MYLLRGFKKLVIVFFTVKNTHNLINLSLFHGVKIVNRQKINNISIKEKLTNKWKKKKKKNKQTNYPRHVKKKKSYLAREADVMRLVYINGLRFSFILYVKFCTAVQYLIVTITNLQHIQPAKTFINQGSKHAWR